MDSQHELESSSIIYSPSITRIRRIRILRKLGYYFLLRSMRKSKNKNTNKKGQLDYVFEYLMKPEHLGRFVKQGDILLYCDKRRNEDTEGKHPNYKDNSRQVEKMRKDMYPLEWEEVSKNGDLWFKFVPEKKRYITDTIIKAHQYKKDAFDKAIIREKMQLCNYKCSITGIPQHNGDLAADHFIPKEKGGLSVAVNCVIINKLLNEQKNKKMPVEWFCETLLTNFMNICKSVNMLEECKETMIQFIREF